MFNLFLFYNHWQVPRDVVYLKACLKLATARKLGMPGRISGMSKQFPVTETNMGDNKPFLELPPSHN